MKSLINRIKRHQRNILSSKFMKKITPWPAAEPYISFAFDDFPRSAFITGGEILGKYNLKASYYVSLGLIGRRCSFWEYCNWQDITLLFSTGHELGSHTYDHLDAWKYRGKLFERSILRNQEAIRQIKPDFVFETFSYCIRNPYPTNKKIAGKYFLCCRGGMPKLNYGKIDLNLLNSYFIDQNNRNEFKYFQKLIDQTLQYKGWLIISTHDISKNPSPYGCTPEFFESIVQYAKSSGAKILPINAVFKQVFRN